MRTDTVVRSTLVASGLAIAIAIILCALVEPGTLLFEHCVCVMMMAAIAGTWCWIQDENGSLYHLYFFDIPLFVCLLFVVVCYSGSIVVMRQAAGAAGNRLEKQIVVKLMLRVVLVFFKSRLWGTCWLRRTYLPILFCRA